MLVIGSRGSQLALWQARWVQARLAEFGAASRVEIIKTTGDKITDVPLAKVGAKGLFTKEIEEALQQGRVDLAVHSLKDLPTDLPPGLAIAAIPAREDPRDALVGRGLADLAVGARVGTSSLRRSAQLQALRPDLKIEPLRGNLDTRLRKLDEDQYDAIVLAAAGLRRLGLENRITELLPVETMCPAVGQGALAIETRDDGGEAFLTCRRLDDPHTRTAITAERALLSALGGGCQVPIGCYARVASGSIELRAVVCAPDGARVIRREITAPAHDPEALGSLLARDLLAAGAREVLEAVYGRVPLLGTRVVVTRAAQQSGDLARRLRDLGAEVMELPTIEIQPPSDFTALDRAIAKLASYDWIIFTSANGVKFFQERLPGGVENVRANICAIGPATRKAVEMLGLMVHLVPKEYVAESLVEAFSTEDLNGKRILLPRAAVARDVVPEQLRRLGARVDVVEAYRTAVPANAAARAREIFSAARKPDWITFTSSSTVKNFFAAGGAGALEGVRVASIGPVTSKTVRSLGMTVTAEASVYTTDGLIEAILSATG